MTTPNTTARLDIRVITMWCKYVSKESAPCVQAIGLGLLAFTSAEILSISTLFISALALFIHEIIIVGYDNVVLNTLILVFLCHLMSFVLGTILIYYYPQHVIVFFSLSVTLIVFSAVLLIICKNNDAYSRIITECTSIHTHLKDTISVESYTDKKETLSSQENSVSSAVKKTIPCNKQPTFHTDDYAMRERIPIQHKLGVIKNTDLSAFL